MRRVYSRKKIEDTKELRSIKKTIRLSHKEMQIVEAKMENYRMPFGEIARNLLLDLKINDKLEIDFIIELRKIGTNINQMAKVINSGNTDIIDIQASWDNIEKELKGRFLNGG